MKKLIERHVHHETGLVKLTYRYTDGPHNGQLVQYTEEGTHVHGPIWPTPEPVVAQPLVGGITPIADTVAQPATITGPATIDSPGTSVPVVPEGVPTSESVVSRPFGEMNADELAANADPATNEYGSFAESPSRYPYEGKSVDGTENPNPAQESISSPAVTPHSPVGG